LNVDTDGTDAMTAPTGTTVTTNATGMQLLCVSIWMQSFIFTVAVAIRYTPWNVFCYRIAQ